MILENATVLVTGGTGFLGSKLVERLLEAGAHPRLLVRSTLGTDTLIERGIELVTGDLSIDDALERAVDGCTAVVHCAYSPSPDLEGARRANVAGTLALAAAAERAGVHRLVHTSTAAVHGEAIQGTLDEDAPLVRSGPVYNRVKVEIEEALFDFADTHRLEVVAVRPTLIYGPGSWTWTTQPLQRVRYEAIRLIDGGRGAANLVFVDDVADALLRAAATPDAGGEAFLVSGAEPVTWKELLNGYAAILGKPAPAALSARRARRLLRIDSLRHRLLRRPPRIVPLDLRMQTQRHRVSIDKARRQLGYEPRFDLERGLERIREWAPTQGILPLGSGIAPTPSL